MSKERVKPKAKTIILWGREDSLAEGAELFLNSQEGWEVIHITDQFDAGFLCDEMKRLNPDVVIIYLGSCADATDVTAKLMKDQPNLKVVTVTLENNFVEVYDKQKVWVNKVSDLISILDA